MGNHSKTGILQRLNTGSVIGPFCNVFGGDFPDRHLPAFSWAGKKTQTHLFEKAMETANKVLQRRSQSLDQQAKDLFYHIFTHSATHRLACKIS